MTMQRCILVVDDNRQYRSAVARNLTLEGYSVIEAEDSREGMEMIQTQNPQVVITDLDMRTHDEGLTFIQDVKRRYPSLPIIMISAVGTFDEGALAKQYGALFVLSKSRIDAEIETLYQRLDHIYSHFKTMRDLHAQADAVLAQGGDFAPLRDALNQLLIDQNLDTGLKSEVFELLDRLDQQTKADSTLLDEAERKQMLDLIRREMPEIDQLDTETQSMLSVAERMQSSPSASTLSVARNISFSYSFAVENEVKLRIGRKVTRLINSDDVEKLALDFYDPQLRNLDIFFNQYLVRMVQLQNLELNSDICRQVMERMIQHGSKYKPDGLKALGVIVFCWGRNHEFANRKKKIQIKNPLGIKNLPDEKVSELASQLILLQHLRNPFIHPEFNEREKTESLRAAAFACLRLISQVV
ncbi:MAG: response regulator [bacterium]|jgi:DNA-binding response OmpR family regulator|nr:response regulator [bacterium]